MAKIELEINSCKDCPFFERKRIYTDDSWEEGYDWLCKKHNNNKIASFVEWNEEKSVKVPEWCPILIE